MTNRIESLTPAQEAQMAPWAAKWTALALSTEPADRPAAESSLRAMYRYARLAEPEIVWASNPQEMGQILADSDTGEAVWDAVDTAVRDAVDTAVRSAVDTAVRSAVDTAVRSAVWSAVWSAVRSALRSAVRSAVRSAMESVVRSAVRSAYDGGQNWASWTAAESYYREVCGLTLPGDLSDRGKALADYRSSVGPGLWFERLAILCERPLSFTPLTWRR